MQPVLSWPNNAQNSIVSPTVSIVDLVTKENHGRPARPEEDTPGRGGLGTLNQLQSSTMNKQSAWSPLMIKTTAAL
jgi:hypothetical protein